NDAHLGQVLLHLVSAVEHTLRTNLHLSRRHGLALRLDPRIVRFDDRALPYGVFFVHGRSFNGFHVRFRDIARGGIRAVRTIGTDQHARECERLYDEVYGLSFAQQLKNKDIPEGGSKGVVLLEPETPVARCVKAFVDSLLDLITPDPETRSRIVDRFGHEELLYLGPDENITPELIVWVVDRAARRGYAMPTALMSSKPGAGINHKTYGVTSEGVCVFLTAALRHVGIDPQKQPFTIKITGGPDGDVAGNMIRILDRDFGANARIVGIADGSGSGEDPDGLDHEELLRLFREALPIAGFSREKLGPKGRIVAVDEPDGVNLRNTLHFRVRSDAFVPGGGRPSTIHGGNWRDYLDDRGQPSSPVIVEGANLFLTPEARRNLSQHGCLIIKDSSANKCGVITSSFEIGACMLLDEKTFLDIKTIFVEQVLEKLRLLAQREADLLLRMNRNQPEVPLFEFSIRLSRVIIRVADAIEASIDDLEKADRRLMRSLVEQHLPQVLLDTVGDRIWNDLPRPYLRWIMAKSLAARIVYREGFELLEHMNDAVIARSALRFLRVEAERRGLAEELRSSGLENRERIASLLDHAGILAVAEEA
ncbi:MAG: NAD-glutamate dehydrogenase, partial [Planctomycetes bacterium]|nr:NAD-glutamate dehydrogenase [Planctomycetota bacterium]